MIKFIKFIFNIILLPFKLVYGLIKLILSPLTAVIKLILGLVMIAFLTYAYYNQETVIAEVKSIKYEDVKEATTNGINTLKSIKYEDVKEATTNGINTLKSIDYKEKYETIKRVTNETNN